jgi:hypothetical protein
MRPADESENTIATGLTGQATESRDSRWLIGHERARHSGQIGRAEVSLWPKSGCDRATADSDEQIVRFVELCEIGGCRHPSSKQLGLK